MKSDEENEICSNIPQWILLIVIMSMSKWMSECNPTKDLEKHSHEAQFKYFYHIKQKHDNNQYTIRGTHKQLQGNDDQQ